MRALKIETIGARCKTPLVVRGSLPRTFWSLGLFVEASLFFSGIYLLAIVIRQPLEADQVTILSAGVILALATVLLYYLVQPRRRVEMAKREDSRGEGERPPELGLTNYGETTQARIQAERALEKEELPGPM